MVFEKKSFQNTESKPFKTPKMEGLASRFSFSFASIFERPSSL